jgi:hypothetical protein
MGYMMFRSSTHYGIPRYYSTIALNQDMIG